MDLKPYIALDIETTGLMEYDQVLQVAMIFDDFSTSVEQLEKISFLVDNSEEIYHGALDPKAISMNSWIFKELSQGHSNHLIFRTERARGVFHDFLTEINTKRGITITFAGKNVKEFDIATLKRNGFINSANENLISHRVIDTGSLYLPEFGYVPTQNEINKFIGRKAVTHDALDDATDVVCAVRSKMKVAV